VKPQRLVVVNEIGAGDASHKWISGQGRDCSFLIRDHPRQIRADRHTIRRFFAACRATWPSLTLLRTRL